MVGAFKAIEFISDICYAAIQKKQRMEHIGISRAIRALLVFLVTIVLLILTGSLAKIMAGWVLVYCAVAFFYDLPTARRFYPATVDFSLTRTVQICKQAIPLVAVVTLLTINANISRYVIAHYLSEAEVGYFGSMNYGLVAMSMIFIAIGNAILPKMVESFSNKPLYIWQLIAKAAPVIVALSIGAFVASLFLGRTALRIFFTPEHASYVNVLWILMASSVLVGLASLMGFAGTACRAFTASAVVWVAVVCSTLVVGIVLVPRSGIVGAAYAASE